MKYAVALASCLGLLLSSICAAATSRALMIVGAAVIHPDRPADKALAQGETIFIVGSTIRYVGPAEKFKAPPNTRILDASGKWVIPGLIDAHVHFAQSGNLYTRPDIADFNRWQPYAQEVKRNKARVPATFKVWLASGVTGVVDLGGPTWSFDVRSRSRKTVAAPHVAVAGPMVSLIPRPQLALDDPPMVYVTSAEEARQLVARNLQRRPDYIKIMWVRLAGDDLQAQTEIVRAAAEAAHAAHVPVAVHATDLDVAKAALTVGADYLVHSVDDKPVDDEFIELLRKRQALYCPTLAVIPRLKSVLANSWVATPEEARLADPEILRTMGDLNHIPPEYIPEIVKTFSQKHVAFEPPAVALENLRRVWAEGITVVMGTDAGAPGNLHGPAVFREMQYMHVAGLSPLEILRTATVNGARALHMQSEVGRIEAGMAADLVVLEANPLSDIDNLSHIHSVIRGGVLFDPAELIRSIS
jgi:imidazolonepropionase-like amidohydrolase